MYEGHGINRRFSLKEYHFLELVNSSLELM